MNFKVLFIHPLENGLKSYLKVDGKIYFITFETKKNKAEFTVYSEDESDKFLKNSEIRQEMLNRFILFLKQNKEEIKVGIYFDKSEEMYERFFELKSLNKLENGYIEVSFSILDDTYTISNLKAIKNRDNIFWDLNNVLFKHENPNCFCENIKHNHDIHQFEHCLVLIEHQDIILDWITKEYKKKFLPKKTTKIIQFPQK